jgi:hypothetical protein
VSYRCCSGAAAALHRCGDRVNGGYESRRVCQAGRGVGVPSAGTGAAPAAPFGRPTVKRPLGRGGGRRPAPGGSGPGT